MNKYKSMKSIKHIVEWKDEIAKRLKKLKIRVLQGLEYMSTLSTFITFHR